MAEAEVGDDVYGEDPTTNRLEDAAAEMVGKAAAVYMPSGTMCNQTAIALHTRPGSEALAAARAHVIRYEMAGAARNAGVQVKGLPDERGFFGGADVRRAVETSVYHQPPVSLVAIENTSQAASGRAWRPREIDDVADAAGEAGLPVHCDGARIFNAAVALDVPAAELAHRCESVMFCVSKGLGAPVGSLLCGGSEFVDRAREERRRLGGAMRQAGIVAAGGLHALEHHVDRLADDHLRARRIAEVVADRFPGAIDPATVETNMVCCDASVFPEKFPARLADRGIRVGMLDPQTVRFATHLDVDDTDVDRLIAAIDEIVAEDR